MKKYFNFIFLLQSWLNNQVYCPEFIETCPELIETCYFKYNFLFSNPNEVNTCPIYIREEKSCKVKRCLSKVY